MTTQTTEQQCKLAGDLFGLAAQSEPEAAETLTKAGEALNEYPRLLRDNQGFLDVSDVRQIWHKKGETFALVRTLNETRLYLREMGA